MLVSALALAGASPAVAADQPKKIIIDTDFNVMGDDGQLAVMAAQLQAEGVVKVMGITVVSGNQWLKQGVADALKTVERMGIADPVGVYAGANHPLSHDYKTIAGTRSPPAPPATAISAPGARRSRRATPTSRRRRTVSRFPPRCSRRAQSTSSPTR